MKRLEIVLSSLLLLAAVLSPRAAAQKLPDAVDLGLPSGLKWASCNVGASLPTDLGDCFAWGETAAKADYSFASYKWAGKAEEELVKYNPSSAYHGSPDGLRALLAEDDAATAAYGAPWRTPTQEEFIELRFNCDWEWIVRDGVAGYLIKSRANSNSIFLPAAGFKQAGNEVGRGLNAYGDYWTSSLGGACPVYAAAVSFNADLVNWATFERWNYGFSIRAVRK